MDENFKKGLEILFIGVILSLIGAFNYMAYMGVKWMGWIYVIDAGLIVYGIIWLIGWMWRH